MLAHAFTRGHTVEWPWQSHVSLIAVAAWGVTLFSMELTYNLLAIWLEIAGDGVVDN